LGKFGIQEVDAIGQAFDPTLHEAIGSEETSEFEPGHVARVLKKAFKMHDRLIRPAQVIVAKEPTKDASN
jgi:molecular chaperone GrpE